jgi:para-aminobenzoate synthetase/4-amino-4-deoxychorismate lyase
MTAGAHAAKVAAVRAAIARGDVNQANLAGFFRFPLPGDPYSLYLRLRAAQPVPFGAFLRAGDACIVSQSPELFFRVRGRRIETRPMKGTAAPGATDAEDRAAAAALRADPKNRAENVMIVDLLRNDLGRLCEPGSIRTTRLFEVQRFRTVLQMVSTVSGTLRGGIDPPSLFRALFPCGSITGAPRIAAVRLLRSVEPEARGVYTGAIGLMLPGGDMTFSVAIRTVTTRDGQAAAGAGGGIVWDSDAAEEYEEVFRKGRFLSAAPPDFRLIETMAWRPGEGIRHLPAHLRRLAASARHFGFPWKPRAVRAAIAAAADAARDGLPKRVRLLLDDSGQATVALAPLPPPAGGAPWKVRLSPVAVSSSDPFLRHKTTRRALYDAEREKAVAEGFDETLFLNERGELTEGTITNVFLEIGGRLFTPPGACGLLEGVGRRRVLSDPANRASVRILAASDLRNADRIFLCNAIRGLFPARLAD